jgi:hypothetical protein
MQMRATRFAQTPAPRRCLIYKSKSLRYITSIERLVCTEEQLERSTIDQWKYCVILLLQTAQDRLACMTQCRQGDKVDLKLVGTVALATPNLIYKNSSCHLTRLL